MKTLPYDQERFTVWALPNVLMLHWVLNPGLAINELVLGQRVPAIMLIDQTSDKPLAQRSYVPCPHCGTIHPGLLWGKGNAFGHWFGYICPTCDETIPCLRNWTSWLILLVTYPFWIFPSQSIEARYLVYEKTRLARNMGKPPVAVTAAKTLKWTLIAGLGWGGMMWLVMYVIPVIYTYWRNPTTSLNIGPIVYGLPIAGVFGLIWGLWMYFFMSKKGARAAKVAEPTSN